VSARRGAAVASLALGAAALALALVLGVERFPRGIAVLACLWVALWAGWLALRSRGLPRLSAAGVTSVALVSAILVLVLTGGVLLDLAVVILFGLSLLLARVAFRVRVARPPAPRPARPVLFFNPRSGGGKATRFGLADEARERGIEPIELRPGLDLRDLVEEAVAGGADALSMAGGDGSQAIVAEIAAREGLPYACIPAGTRNHFALDLGVDREDVVGALDALVEGGERRVDLAEVNGRVFVNNVSLGLYASAVQQDGYRDAKIRTLLEVAPTELAGEEDGPTLRWRGPEGEAKEGAVALLVSNNVYRLGAGIGSGTRPRLDQGDLGVVVVRRGSAAAGGGLGLAFERWRSPEFTVEADASIPAGIDGEAVTLASPVRFDSRPAALRVRIAADHPGASPSAAVPHGLWAVIGELFAIAAGRREAADL
jgi:diacylglycerol kinase family enzyme